MRRASFLWVCACGVLMMLGCREPLDFDQAFTADPARGQRLYQQNCANTCHPDNAFEHKHVTSYEQLAYTVRDYYEKALGKDAEFTAQDVFDISTYLNENYYHFKTGTP